MSFRRKLSVAGKTGKWFFTIICAVFVVTTVRLCFKRFVTNCAFIKKRFAYKYESKCNNTYTIADKLRIIIKRINKNVHSLPLIITICFGNVSFSPLCSSVLFPEISFLISDDVFIRSLRDLLSFKEHGRHYYFFFCTFNTMKNKWRWNQHSVANVIKKPFRY